MRPTLCAVVSLFLVVLAFSGCTNQEVSNVLGNTPGERESKTQEEMSRLRGVSPFEVGQGYGRADAFELTTRLTPQEPTESELIDREALRRIGEELPLFNAVFDDGFRAGWQEVFVNHVDAGSGSRIVAGRVAQRDFDAGNGSRPERYGFDYRLTRIYREQWNLAEEAAAPVTGTLRIGSNPYAFDDDSYALRGSCFVAGTRVLMADGRTRSIEDVRVGDMVLGRDGAVSRVTGIERPRLGARLLYGFNGGPPFVTAEHPFMTAEGWKAIDPAATLAENPDLAVGALVAGDRVVRAVNSEARVVPAAWTPGEAPGMATIRDIAGVPGDPDMVLYNLLLDGDHSYFADGWLVHNKGGG